MLDAVDAPMRVVQRVLGVPRIAWMFVAPNLAILGLFTFLPIVINFYFAFTGGVALYPSQRPFTGLENLETLFECGSYLDPSSCRKDLFWRAIFNTGKFAVLQVGLMVVFALVTALVLNRKILGRGFFRGVFFYPVLLSPVVVALIWKWMLQREGVLNAFLAGAGASPVGWLSEAELGVLLVRVREHLGAHGLLHADPARRPPGDPGATCTRRRRWTARRHGAGFRASPCRCSCRTSSS